MVSLTRQVPRLLVPYCIFDSRPTLVLDDWISMKFEELSMSRDGAAYSVHYLSPSREGGSVAPVSLSGCGETGEAAQPPALERGD